MIFIDKDLRIYEIGSGGTVDLQEQSGGAKLAGHGVHGGQGVHGGHEGHRTIEGH